MSEDKIDIDVRGYEPVPDVGAMTTKGLSFGIFENVAEAEYFRLPAINSSLLRQFNEPNTPAHVREYIRRPSKRTPAMMIGSAYHAYVLGQPTFGAYLLLPPGETRVNKTAKDAKARGQEVLRDVEVAMIKAMKSALYAHPTISGYLLAPSAQKELTVVWRERVDVDGVTIEVPCKARLDDRVFVGKKIAADLKSARSAAPGPFAESVAKYDYHEQGAWYMRGLEMAGDPADEFVIVAQEKTAPYVPAARRMSEQALAQGRLQWERNLLTLTRCLRDDSWPGYGQGLDDIELPGWKVDPSLKSKTYAAIAGDTGDDEEEESEEV